LQGGGRVGGLEASRGGGDNSGEGGKKGTTSTLVRQLTETGHPERISTGEAKRGG